MAGKSLSKDIMGQTASAHSGSKMRTSSRPSNASEKSEKPYGDSTMSANRGGSRMSRRMSKYSETVTVVSDCTRSPDICVLCGYGIPYTKCLCCEFHGHNRCIEAFFCTTRRRVNLENWKCPKCVTLSNINKKSKDERLAEFSKASQVDMLSEISEEEPDCPFCKIDRELKNCNCHECVNCLAKDYESHKLGGDQEEKAYMQKYNKCLQYRDFSTKIEYKYLEDEDDLEGDEEIEDSILVKICWSISWCLLLLTFAFPLAFISASIFIFIYCFEACCESCHPVCCFFLSGIKLPGTCCRGICSGEPMCSSNEEVEEC